MYNMIKYFPIITALLLFLTGCGDCHYLDYREIDSTDKKVICEYISKMVTIDLCKPLVIDQNSITVYITKKFNQYDDQKTIIVGQCKLGNEDYYIRIIHYKNARCYAVTMNKKEIK